MSSIRRSFYKKTGKNKKYCRIFLEGCTKKYIEKRKSLSLRRMYFISLYVNHIHRRPLITFFFGLGWRIQTLLMKYHIVCYGNERCIGVQYRARAIYLRTSLQFILCVYVRFVIFFQKNCNRSSCISNIRILAILYKQSYARSPMTLFIDFCARNKHPNATVNILEGTSHVSIPMQCHGKLFLCN